MAEPALLSRRRCLTLVGTLYVWQGLVAGFAVTALPNYYAGLGASTQDVGTHIAAVGLPWILQPLWGPIVDRFGSFAMGRRRFWIVAAFVCSLFALARLLLIPANPVTALSAISAVFLVQSAFAALADTATDALIIDHVPADGLGVANAVTRTGFLGGGALSAAFFAWMLPNHGLHMCVTVLLACGVTLLALPVLLREDAKDAWLSFRLTPAIVTGQSWNGVLRRLALSLSGWRPLAILLACFAIDATSALFGLPLAIDMIQQRGWSAEFLSGFQATAALLAGTVGTLLVGWWVDRVGVAHALVVFLSFCGLVYVSGGTALLFLEPAWLTIVVPVILALTITMPALLFVTLSPAIMRASAGPVAATRFALFMASLNAGNVTGSAGASRLAEVIGLFWVGIAVGLFFASLVLLLRSRVRHFLNFAPRMP